MTPTFISKVHSEDLTLRASALVATHFLKEVQKIHQSSPVATIAMGRLITGALLMASGLAEKQQVSLRLQGDGPLGEISADSNFECEARVYCANPQLDVPMVGGRLPVGPAVGSGLLTVSRFHEFHKHPQISLIEIQTGEIAEDLSYYYQQSQQTPTIVALSVSLDKDGNVQAAGGVILELMPGAPESLIQKLEAQARQSRPLSELILKGATALDLVKQYAHTTPLKESIHPHQVKYHCPCSRERVDRTLKLLGKGALAEMILKGTPSEVQCHFCGRTYQVELSALRQLHDELITH
jgi:molecular chaperone Hsp33